MFHSPPLIRALQMSKSETTAKISQETWNQLHIAHMCWDDYVTDGTCFYRPLMNKVIQKAFTAEIRHIGLQGDNAEIKLKRISATQAIAIKKAWTCIEDDQLKGTVFTWEAPLEAHSLWTSPKKGTLVTCVKTPPNPALGELLDQTGTLVPGKDETTIQIKFISGKITWPREHVDYITAREPNCLWRITDIRPDTNNNIMVTVNPVKRNNSKTDTRIIPIKVAKTLITHHINQEMIDSHDPLEDFPNIREQIQIPTKSLHRYFTHETCPFSVQWRTQNPDESRTFLNVAHNQNFSLNRGHIILAIQREPKTGRRDMPINLPHDGASDKFISDDEILELLNHVRKNPTTLFQHADHLESTPNTRLPKCSNSKFQQYMRISRPAWNIFLKCYLCLRPKTDKPITIDFHDTWDALVKQNNNALRNRPGIGYLINHGRPSGLEWTCIGKTTAPSTHIHTSFQLKKLIESKTTNWAITKDWTNQHVELSHLEWDNLEIPKLAIIIQL